MKDDTAISSIVSTVMNDFWDFTITPVKKRYGISNEQTGLNSGTKPEDKRAGESRDASDQK